MPALQLFSNFISNSAHQNHKMFTLIFFKWKNIFTLFSQYVVDHLIDLLFDCCMIFNLIWQEIWIVTYRINVINSLTNVLYFIILWINIVNICVFTPSIRFTTSPTLPEPALNTPPWMSKWGLSRQSTTSSVFCVDVLGQSCDLVFKNADLVLRKHLLLLSVKNSCAA